MKNLNQWSFTYLKWMSPVAFVAAILSASGQSGSTPFYHVIGWVTSLWIVCLIYTVFSIGLSPERRNSFVRRLSGIKENDEREVQITGDVSKKTFIFMTGVLTLLLFLSVIQISIYRYADPSAVSGDNGAVKVGITLRFIESNSKQATPADELSRDYIVKYSGLPLTSDGTLILVLLLQVGAFYYFSRGSGSFIHRNESV